MTTKNLDETWCLDLLKDLIALPSPTGEEGRVAAYLEARLQELGLTVARQAVAEGRWNVVGRKRFASGGPTLLVGGHLDTVRPAGSWTRDPFTPTVEGDRLYGLGAADMKGGLAALLAALKALGQAGRGEIVFVGLVDEEACSLGAKAFLAAGLRADLGLLAEPHFDELVVGGLGKVLLEVQLRGRPGHASSPESGINAIVEAARLIARLDDLPLAQDERLGRGSQCVLRISGGPQEYSLSIPETCSFQMNRHLVPAEGAATVQADLKRLAERIGLRADLEVHVREPYYPAYALEADEPIVRLVQEAWREERGAPLRLARGRSVSDANLLVQEGGLPTVLFGPQGGNLHSGDEFVQLESVLAAARIYVRVFERLFQGRPLERPS